RGRDSPETDEHSAVREPYAALLSWCRERSYSHGRLCDGSRYLLVPIADGSPEDRMTRIAPDVFNANCDSREVLDLIADRWSMLVIYALSNQVRRHGDLKRRIGGISQKMLTQTLRLLERDGLVRRSVYDVVPPHVEYALTTLGTALFK